MLKSNTNSSKNPKVTNIRRSQPMTPRAGVKITRSRYGTGGWVK